MKAIALITAWLVLLLATPTLADEIYRWVDANGVVHFSDVPRDGAERFSIDPSPTFSLPRVAAAASAGAAAQAEPDEKGYDSLQIVSPSQEETIWNTGGVITVTVSPTPGLKQGHSIRIFYNGTPVQGTDPRATSVQLSEVYRGEHTIGAEIRNKSGKVLIKANPVTFFYKQTAR